MNTEQKQFLQKLIKEAGKGLVILIVAVMAFKFMSWNSWKLEQVADIAGNIGKEPPAVNLVLLEKDKPGFQKSFVHNEKGNYYLINNFDISGYLKGISDNSGSSIKITVNNREVTSFLLFRFKRYHVLYTGEYYFVFMAESSGIEDLVRLNETVPAVVNSLFKLAVSSNDEERKENIAQYFQGVEKEINYGKARISIPLTGTFKKGKLYEIYFEYKVSGEAKPVVVLASVANRHKLDIKGDRNYRKAVLMYSPQEDTTGLVLHLLGRHTEKKGRFDGAVSFKDVSIYCHENSHQGTRAPRYTKGHEREYPWLKEFPVLQVTYLDFIAKIKDEFLGTSFFEK